MKLSTLLFSFNGRINRLLWWIIILVPNIVLIIVNTILETIYPPETESVMPEHIALIILPVFIVLYLLYMWVGLAVTVKRYHDMEKSGWNVLIILIPAVGALVILIVCGCLRGTDGVNRFGNDPLADYG